MAEGFASGTADAVLAEFVALDTNQFFQHHTGAPGAPGTSNVATETTRKQISWDTPSGGLTTDADLEWTNVAGSEDYTHFSIWSLITDGTFRLSGTTTANAVTAGDTFTIAAGDLDVTLNVAS